MDEIISYKMCAVKVRNAKLRNYLKILCQILLKKISCSMVSRGGLLRDLSKGLRT
jgi:hypothetical protein